MALNYCVLLGRLTSDPEVKSTQNGKTVATFTVAVDRGYVKQGEERQSDFIKCVAWEKVGQFVSSYFSKGRMIAIEGRLQTRTYDDNNGVKHYVTEVIVNQASFTGEKKSDNTNSVPSGQPPIADVPAEFDSVSDAGVPF